MFPKVSILFPVYKTAAYLREALDSMLNQTFTDFELIVLDDCSPDNSPEILDTYTDSRIVRYRGEKNQGLANVLNVGLSMARGEYIARMDSDDISLPDRLKVEVEYLDAHPDIDLVSVGMQMFGANNRVLCHPESTEYVKCAALVYSPVLHASSMWRRQRFAQANLVYRQEMVPAEDYDLWTRALVADMHLINIPVVLYKYRMHAEQTTANPVKNDEKKRSILRSYLSNVFPLASEKTIDYLYDISPCLSCVSKWRRYVRVMENENEESAFFDSKYLRAFLKKQLRHHLYWSMRTHGINWQIVFLRPKQIKLLLFNRN